MSHALLPFLLLFEPLSIFIATHCTSMSLFVIVVVKAPPMVGPTWMRVCFTVGSDCLPSQGTASLLPRVFWSAYCSHAHDSMVRMIQGCISTLHSVMSPWGLLFTSYSVCLHGILYPMMDCYAYDWWRVSRPASADALQVYLRFYY